LFGQPELNCVIGARAHANDDEGAAFSGHCTVDVLQVLERADGEAS
jgi:hypothetical protein